MEKTGRGWGGEAAWKAKKNESTDRERKGERGFKKNTLKGSEEEEGEQMEERAAEQEGRGSKSCMRRGHGEKEARQKGEGGSGEQK